MVKQINVFLDDEEHEKIKSAKGDMTWLDFLTLASELIKKEKKKR